MKKFNELKEHNKRLVFDITNAEQVNDNDLSISLKRILYQNKLQMLDLITIKNKSNNFTAEELKLKIKNMKPIARYETGLSWLDHELKFFDNSMMKGFEVGSLIILAGASGAGKSHFLLDILKNISKYNKCIFFNFEMGDRRLNYRLSKLLTTDEQYKNFIINNDSRDLDDLLMEITLLADEGVKFIAIDSKMKITVKGSEAEYQKISKITKTLSAIAIKTDIIIFLINQISEEDLKSNRLSFKGSGDQIYDADMALFITVDTETNRRSLHCIKSRQDERTFTIDMPLVLQNILVEEIEYKEGN